VSPAKAKNNPFVCTKAEVTTTNGSSSSRRLRRLEALEDHLFLASADSEGAPAKAINKARRFRLANLSTVNAVFEVFLLMAEALRRSVALSLVLPCVVVKTFSHSHWPPVSDLEGSQSIVKSAPHGSYLVQ
jgi:hypothetical protein